jgi:hypothetical protein
MQIYIIKSPINRRIVNKSNYKDKTKESIYKNTNAMLENIL